jgi:hypothetical protein
MLAMTHRPFTVAGFLVVTSSSPSSSPSLSMFSTASSPPDTDWSDASPRLLPHSFHLTEVLKAVAHDPIGQNQLFALNLPQDVLESRSPFQQRQGHHGLVSVVQQIKGNERGGRGGGEVSDLLRAPTGIAVHQGVEVGTTATHHDQFRIQSSAPMSGS